MPDPATSLPNFSASSPSGREAYLGRPAVHLPAHGGPPTSPSQANDAVLRDYRRTGHRSARDAAIERYVPLAHALARRYQRGRAVRGPRAGRLSCADPSGRSRLRTSRTTAFSSYAVPCISGALERQLPGTDRLGGAARPATSRSSRCASTRSPTSSRRRPARPADAGAGRRAMRGERGDTCWPRARRTGRCDPPTSCSTGRDPLRRRRRALAAREPLADGGARPPARVRARDPRALLAT